MNQKYKNKLLTRRRIKVQNNLAHEEDTQSSNEHAVGRIINSAQNRLNLRIKNTRTWLTWLGHWTVWNKTVGTRQKETRAVNTHEVGKYR